VGGGRFQTSHVIIGISRCRPAPHRAGLDFIFILTTMRVNKVLEYGLSESTDIEIRRHVVFSNLVYILVGTVLLANSIISFIISPNFTTEGSIPLVLIGVSALSFFMNAFGFHLVSRIFFVVNWFAWVSFVPMILIGPSQVSYFTAITYFIVFSPVIQLFFSMSREAPYLIFFMVASFLLTYFYFDFLLLFDRAADPHVPLARSVIMLKVNYLTLWVFLNILMMYVLRINRSFYSEIKVQKEIIEKQQIQLRDSNDELALRNGELTEANRELTFLNHQVRTMNHELEDRVSERTHELVERNDKLTEYAFMNAHLLRSPVSRIKGLINLFGITKEADEKERVQSLLNQTAEELDQVIHTISDRLNKPPNPSS
jgi:signal transduction histidine kinase